VAIGVLVFFLDSGQPGEGIRVAQHAVDHIAGQTLGFIDRDFVQLIAAQILEHLPDGMIDVLMQLAGLADFPLERFDLAVLIALNPQRRDLDGHRAGLALTDTQAGF
jgi:hypothetical protein